MDREHHLHKNILHKIRSILWKFGLDVSPFTARDNPLARRIRLLHSFDINLVMDVGASTGGFAWILRNDLGYKGRIVSFEPLSTAYQLLSKHAYNDPLWDVIHCALGDHNRIGTINVSKNSDSSSILPMLPAHIKNAPHSIYITRETIEIKSIDSMIGTILSPGDRVYLKIDTQGYEDKVIDGAKSTLRHIDTIQVEMSLTPLYEGSILFPEMCILLKSLGYTLVSIESGFCDPDTGQLLQVDGIFHRY